MPVSRVHNYIIMQRSLDAVNRAMDRMQKTQEKLATGRNINRISDDPVGVGSALHYKTNISKNEYYVEGINKGISTINQMNTTLENVERILAEIKDISQEASQTYLTSAERSAIALDVNNLLVELIDTTNSKSQGKFLFGGTETLSGSQSLAKPFNAQYNAAGTLITGVVQNPRGINFTAGHLTSDANNVTVRISGAAPFQPNGEKGVNDVFQSVVDLRDAIMDNNIGVIDSAIATLDQATDSVLNYETILGAKHRRLTMTKERIEQIDLDDKDSMSEIMDIDMAEQIMQYNIQNVAYQASLEAASKSIKQSLLDFI